MTESTVLRGPETQPGTAVAAGRPCPVCDGTRAEFLSELHFKLQDGIGIPTASRLIACDGCGMVFQDGEASAADYAAYYEQHSKYSSSPTIQEESRVLFETYGEDFRRLVPRQARILDMGCAGGALLDLLRQDGYGSLVGIDPSPECVRELKGKGLEAYAGSIYGEPGEGLRGTFDLVILSGVMEHLLDPKAALRSIRAYLKSGGMVFVGVPDAERYHLFPNAMAYYFNFEHVNHFSPSSMDNLMAACRLAPVDTGRHEIRFGDAQIPVFAAYYRAVEAAQGAARRDEATRAGVREYLRQQQAQRAGETSVIDELSRSGEEICIWGAGNVAGELLSGSDLGKCRIVSFVDSDPGKQGSTFAGRPVRSPEALRTFPGTVVVCAAVYASEIVKTIRAMGLDNRVVVLK